MTHISKFVRPHKVANYVRHNPSGTPATIYSPRIANLKACKCFMPRTGLWMDRLGRTWYANYFLHKAECLTDNGKWCKLPCATVPLDSLNGVRYLADYAPFRPLLTYSQPDNDGHWHYDHANRQWCKSPLSDKEATCVD